MIQRMRVVQHNNINVPNRPCNPDPSYSFTSCVKESLSKRIGCKLKWDSWTSSDLPICQHMDQYRQFETAYNEIAEAVLPMISNSTGCYPPCSYKEYRYTGEANEAGKQFGTYGYVLWNMSPYVLVETESLLYSIESLVAEFGGTLGLFLGFSFMALWDGLEVMVKILGKLFKKL